MSGQCRFKFRDVVLDFVSLETESETRSDNQVTRNTNKTPYNKLNFITHLNQPTERITSSTLISELGSSQSLATRLD